MSRFLNRLIGGCDENMASSDILFLILRGSAAPELSAVVSPISVSQ
jgi:hypothetical protein